MRPQAPPRPQRRRRDDLLPDEVPPPAPPPPPPRRVRSRLTRTMPDPRPPPLEDEKVKEEKVKEEPRSSAASSSSRAPPLVIEIEDSPIYSPSPGSPLASPGRDTSPLREEIAAEPAPIPAELPLSASDQGRESAVGLIDWYASIIDSVWLHSGGFAIHVSPEGRVTFPRGDFDLSLQRTAEEAVMCESYILVEAECFADFLSWQDVQAPRGGRVNWTRLETPEPAERRRWRNGTPLEFYYSNASTPDRYIKRNVKFKKFVPLREGQGARCTTDPGNEYRTFRVGNMFFDRGGHLT